MGVAYVVGSSQQPTPGGSGRARAPRIARAVIASHCVYDALRIVHSLPSGSQPIGVLARTEAMWNARGVRAVMSMGHAHHSHSVRSLHCYRVSKRVKSSLHVAGPLGLSSLAVSKVSK